MAVKHVIKTFETPATTWVVQHDLGKFVSSDVFIVNDLNQLEKIIPYSIVVVDSNRIDVTFTEPYRGQVKVF